MLAKARRSGLLSSERQARHPLRDALSGLGRCLACCDPETRCSAREPFVLPGSDGLVYLSLRRCFPSAISVGLSLDLNN